MIKMSKRAILCFVMAMVLVAGMLFFAVEYVIYGKNWVVHPANGNVYSDGCITKGSIIDKNGTLLFDAHPDWFGYADSYGVRIATLHAIGDTDGNISTGALSNYKYKLIGYNPLMGVSSKKGGILELSLDADLCAYAYELLNGQKGTIGVYNYKTGEMLCMISAPSFDPNSPISSEDAESEQYAGIYLNKLINGEYTPGSIMKIVTSYAAIENIDDIFEQTFHCEGSMVIDNEEIVCEGYHGDISFEEALSVSCNCAFAQIAAQLDGKTLSEYFEKSGLAESFEVSRNKTAAGSLEVENVREVDKAWSAIGQHKDIINPCAFLRFVGAIANDGVAVDMTYIAGEKTPSKRIMSSETAAVLKSMLERNVTEQYTGYWYGDLPVGAKSGSAEVGTEYTNAMFTGFIDSEEYPYAFIVVSENSGSGSGVAGGIAASIINYIEQ